MPDLYSKCFPFWHQRHAALASSMSFRIWQGSGRLRQTILSKAEAEREQNVAQCQLGAGRAGWAPARLLRPSRGGWPASACSGAGRQTGERGTPKAFCPARRHLTMHSVPVTYLALGHSRCVLPPMHICKP